MSLPMRSGALLTIVYMADAVQAGEIRLVGSSHSGRRGSFQSALFQARRPAFSAKASTWEVTRVPIQELDGELRLMGLAAGDYGLLAVAGSKTQSFLATFDKSLAQTGWHELAGARDPHGLVADDKHIWVVSSGTNEVIRYDFGEGVPANPTVVYRSPHAGPQHFNGLAWHGRQLILSGFGVGASHARSVASSGYLVDIVTGTTVRAGLDQPHSPLSDRGALLFCESKASRIWRDAVAAVELDGYLRGLAAAPDGTIHIAQSASRPPPDQMTADRDDAELLSIAPDGRVLARDRLAGVGAEIYDLVLLPDRREWR